jgi:CBS domain-containing protein
MGQNAPSSRTASSRKEHDMHAGYLSTRSVDTARPDETVWIAAERMHQRGVGSLVVVNDQQVPIGIVTDRDLVERVMAKGMLASEVLVEQVMTQDPETTPPETPIDELVQKMQQGRFRRMPVVDERGRLVGLVSLDDILMRWSETFALVGRLLCQETPQGIAGQVEASTR